MRGLHAATSTLTLLSLCIPTTCATSHPQSQQPSWRRITNHLVAKIWNVPAVQMPLREKKIHVVTPAAESRAGRLAARYGQDIVLRFNVSTASEARAIAEATEDLYLDVWAFNDNYVDIRLAKNIVPSLLGLLPTSLQTACAPLMPESALAEVIDRSLPSADQPTFTPSLKPSSEDIFFQDYQPLSVISPWMRLMSSMFPTHVRLISLGLSYEGREIEALRVGVHPTNNDDPDRPRRKTIIISGGLHAREWISTSTATYIAQKMITQYGKSSTWTTLLESFDWIFIPTLNPDGYEYTWSTDRLWRKNRQPTPLRFCRGIDLDRSFGFQWDGDASGGNPCSESYAGEEAWQAVESRRFADWARNETENNNVEFTALVDLHSYSQQVLYPYSYSCAASPPTLENLEELALGLAKSLRQGNHHHFYKTTSACEGNVNFNSVKGGRKKKTILPRIERGGGSALDWFYHELGVKYAYQVKLRDMGSYGFMLPKENIIPQGREMMQAVTYLGRYLLGGQVLKEDEGLAKKKDGRAEEGVHIMDDDAVVVEKPHVMKEAGEQSPQFELRKRRR
ncbi:hypothetical protein EJ08DRAFT_685907 [Tothia fuscella]|uniref:Inactive metallocarboxypeptidase ECM14 n=1 Tax=Tothia fuscella TaxID=1048955 RepID=A0A9P4P0H0_9PEZI|nr:hypothetical protein EJ08DRAFT_685907 [Tothia fuscella]